MLETPLIDLPTGVCTFYMDDTAPKMPAVAVASGPFVYVYKNLRPYFKFALPTLEVNEAEANLWAQARNVSVCVCVCVCEREREREREIMRGVPQ